MSPVSTIRKLYRENWKVALVDYTALIVLVLVVGVLVTITGESWLWLVAVVVGIGWPAVTPRWTIDGEPIDAPWSGWLWERFRARDR